MSLGQETIFLSDDKVFYTIEGEGEFVGYPSVFMRLSMCNLTCIGFKSEDAPYGCDSYIPDIQDLIREKPDGKHDHDRF